MIICNGYMPGKRQAARRMRGKLVKIPAKQTFFSPATAKLRRATFYKWTKNIWVQPVEKRFWEAWWAAAFPQQAVPGDRRGGFTNLVCLPVAPKAQGKRVLAEKDGAAGLSRHAKNAGDEPIRHAERLRIRLFRHPALYILLPVCYICQQSGAHVPPIIRREAAKKEGQTG